MNGPVSRVVRAGFAVMALLAGLGLGGPLPRAHAVDTAAYIAFVAPMAQRASGMYGVPASVTIAQSILESGWGGSTLATQANAYFGIKCNASYTPYSTSCYSIATQEYDPATGTYYTVTALFRKYAAVEDSILDHGYFLSHSSRYAGAFAYKENPDQFIREVAAAGYATSPTYANSVINIMVRYNLYVFDISNDPSPTVADPGGFVALSPTRYVDTRYTLPVAAYGTLDLLIAGRNGIPADAAAVALNVTVTQPGAAGYVVAYPTGAVQTSSTLNFTPGQTVPNAATVRIGTGGSISLRNASAGSTHLVVDVTGYYRAATGATPGAFLPQTPIRVADSRTMGRVAANTDLVVDVSSQLSAVLGGASAGASAVINVTVTSPQAAGYATAYPADSPLPTASSLNFTAGVTLANMSIVRVGSDGRIRVRNASAGASQLIVDLSGFFVGGTVTMHGGFVPSAVPTRVLDTRIALGYGSVAPAYGRITLNPQLPAAAAVALNVTVTSPQAPGGYIVVWPADRDMPLASQVNFSPGQTIANFGQIRVSAAKTLAIANMSAGLTHIIADVAGYYTT
ncbi:MAG: glucosaminidase domain-containing protein [Propionibacteriaceae bacterium]